MNDKIIGMLGLARRAGALIYGSDSTAQKIRFGKVYLAIVANDASDRTKKLIRNKSTSFNVPMYEYSTAAELGAKLGKSDISVISVSDRNFAKAIINIITSN